MINNDMSSNNFELYFRRNLFSKNRMLDASVFLVFDQKYFNKILFENDHFIQNSQPSTEIDFYMNDQNLEIL